jgi:hypothetical protein
MSLAEKERCHSPDPFVAAGHDFDPTLPKPLLEESLSSSLERRILAIVCGATTAAPAMVPATSKKSKQNWEQLYATLL